jgi:hypothetical protein
VEDNDDEDEVDAEGEADNEIEINDVEAKYATVNNTLCRLRKNLILR